jgi:5-methylthioribose kinase
MGLLAPGEPATVVPLTGGVSSDIQRVDTARGSFCVKRALPRLRVAAVWEAPVERNRYERAWIEHAARVVPSVVPQLLGHDDEAGLFAMTYLDPATHPVWKAALLAGHCDPGVAAAVGAAVGRVHAATADDPTVAAAFPTAGLFAALRLDPYFGVTAAAHPDVAPALDALRARTELTTRVLVHGDVSPKNVLAGPGGPVLLDAECATVGDPAFDLAFCTNHLHLKCVARPEAMPALLEAATELARAYLGEVTWEEPEAVEARAASLVPALLLARVDGASPVEYLDEPQRAFVRRAARGLLFAAPSTLAELRHRWRLAVERQVA